MCAIWGRLGLKVDITTFSPFPSSPVLIDNLPSRLWMFSQITPSHFGVLICDAWINIYREFCMSTSISTMGTEWRRLSTQQTGLWPSRSTSLGIISQEQGISVTLGTQRGSTTPWMSLWMMGLMMKATSPFSSQSWAKLWRFSALVQLCFSVVLIPCLGIGWVASTSQSEVMRNVLGTWGLSMFHCCSLVVVDIP